MSMDPSSSRRSSTLSLQASTPSLRSSIASSLDSASIASICSSSPSSRLSQHVQSSFSVVTPIKMEKSIQKSTSPRIRTNVSNSNSNRISMVSFRRSNSNSTSSTRKDYMNSLSTSQIPFPTPPTPSSPIDICRRVHTASTTSAGISDGERYSLLFDDNRKSMLSIAETIASDDVNVLPTPQSSPQMQKRFHIATEILETEQSYVSQLGVIHDNFLEPLVQHLSDKPILSRADLNIIFSNYVDIYNLSCELLTLLEQRLYDWSPDTGCVGDIFANIAPFFKMYSIYVKNFNSSVQCITRRMDDNREFANFINSRKQYLGGLSFQSHLLKPVQRIPRYKLLLMELLANTPQDHPDHAHLDRACVLIASTAEFINENIRQHELLLELITLQKHLQGLTEPLLIPGRALLKRGTLTKMSRRTLQRRYLFLFTDILIYASPLASLSTSVRLRTLSLGSSHAHSTDMTSDLSGPLQFQRMIDLEDVTVLGSENDENLNSSFDIITSLKSFSLLAMNEKERNEWMDAIREAKQALISSRRSIQVKSLRTRRKSAAVAAAAAFQDNDILLEDHSEIPILEDYAAPVWIPDTKTNKCMSCNELFHSLFRRKHHCRLCGMLVCYACSSRSFRIRMLVDQGDHRQERACDTCWTRLWGNNNNNLIESPTSTKNINEILSPITPPETPIKRFSSFFSSTSTPSPIRSPSILTPQSARQSLQLIASSPKTPSIHRQQHVKFSINTPSHRSIELSSSVPISPLEIKNSIHKRESANMMDEDNEESMNSLWTENVTEKMGLQLFMSKPSFVLETHVEMDDESPNNSVGNVIRPAKVRVQTATMTSTKSKS